MDAVTITIPSDDADTQAWARAIADANDVLRRAGVLGPEE